MYKPLVLALMFVCAGAVFAQAAPSPAPGRVWHVATAPLTGVPSDRQFRTIGEAAKGVGPGDTVRIHSGVYRESVTVEASGTPTRPIRFEAAPAANVTVTGADVLTGWTREPGADNIFSVAWPHTFIGGPTHSHPDDSEHLLIGRAEQVFVQGYALHQVLRREEMSRGTFYADLDAKRLYVWSANDFDITKNGQKVEASTRPILWRSAGDYVAVRGIRFR